MSLLSTTPIPILVAFNLGFGRDMCPPDALISNRGSGSIGGSTIRYVSPLSHVSLQCHKQMVALRYRHMHNKLQSEKNTNNLIPPANVCHTINSKQNVKKRCYCRREGQWLERISPASLGGHLPLARAAWKVGHLALLAGALT